MATRILGWRIDREDRSQLLQRFAPRYPQTVADHITYGPADEAPHPMPAASSATVIGRADDGGGVEALVVMVDGSSDRWDGSTYHITWSLADGREAIESNAVVARHGWATVEDRPNVAISAEEWPWS